VCGDNLSLGGMIKAAIVFMDFTLLLRRSL
jgi:hypothetical protein